MATKNTHSTLGEKEVERIRREAVRDVLSLFAPEGADFYHNEPNDYGCITLRLWTGEGNPEKFQGEKEMAEYGPKREVRWSGRYKLNEAAVDMVLDSIKEREAYKKEKTSTLHTPSQSAAR